MEGLPTIEQLNAQLAEGKHADVLKQVAKLLQLKGEAAKAYDRYDLLCLRGEAALRGKANSMAIEAFSQASRATDDPDKKAVARATEILIRRSKPLGYVPRTAGGATPAAGKISPAGAGPAGSSAGAAGPAGSGPAAAGPAGAAPRATPAKPQANQPIPIIEEADRKRAFAALYADEQAVVDPKVKKATTATSLPPIIEAIKSLGDLRAVDVAANGSAAQTKALGADLGAHAHQLISGALTKMEKRTEECWTAGRRVMVTELSNGSRYRQPGMVGLTSAEQNDLKRIVADSREIQPIAAELAAVTEAAELIADAQTAQRLHARATEVLTFDYPNSGRYNKDPNQPTR
jgi:hypothetical protein